MKIVYLGPPRPRFEAFLAATGDLVVRVEHRLSEAQEALEGADFLVSYGYRYMITDAVLQRFPQRVINLHIALLPWNRGADPNLWSVLEDTPKGVTIHQVDVGLDTGPVLVQQEVSFSPDDTLRNSYARLSQAIEDLFEQHWPAIRSGEREAIPQPGGGSYHRLRDREPFAHLLTQGWDTPVATLIGRANRSTHADS